MTDPGRSNPWALFWFGAAAISAYGIFVKVGLANFYRYYPECEQVYLTACEMDAYVWILSRGPIIGHFESASLTMDFSWGVLAALLSTAAFVAEGFGRIGLPMPRWAVTAVGHVSRAAWLVSLWYAIIGHGFYYVARSNGFPPSSWSVEVVFPYVGLVEKIASMAVPALGFLLLYIVQAKRRVVVKRWPTE